MKNRILLFLILCAGLLSAQENEVSVYPVNWKHENIDTTAIWYDTTDVWVAYVDSIPLVDFGVQDFKPNKSTWDKSSNGYEIIQNFRKLDERRIC